MQRFQRSLDLARASWRVLVSDRELLWLPVLGLILGLAVAAVTIVPALVVGGEWGSDSASLPPMSWVLIAIGAVGVTLVGIFFEGALTAGASQRFAGGDPSIGSSVSAAHGRMHRLIPWAILSVAVSALLSFVRDRGGVFGDIAAALGGLAWSLVTFLAVPVLMIEDRGPIETVKRSSSLFRQTWGENVTAQVGFGLLALVASLPGIAVAGLGFGASNLLSPLLVVVGLAWVVTVSVLVTALSAVFKTALYVYATTGEVPAGYGDVGLDDAFATRPG